MLYKGQKMPRSSSSLRIKRAVAALKKMPMTEKIQLLVEAGLMTQEEADQAKRRLAEKSGAVGAVVEPDGHDQGSTGAG